MPHITRLFIKTSLLYLVAALLAGLLLMLRPLVDLPVIVGGLSPVYFHLFMVGWVMQLIVGVAYWMFPKWSKTRPLWLRCVGAGDLLAAQYRVAFACGGGAGADGERLGRVGLAARGGGDAAMAGRVGFRRQYLAARQGEVGRCHA